MRPLNHIVVSVFDLVVTAVDLVLIGIFKYIFIAQNHVVVAILDSVLAAPNCILVPID